MEPSVGLAFASTKTNPKDFDVHLTNICPSRREWLPQLIEELLPWMVQAVEEVATQYDPVSLARSRPGLIPEGLKREQVDASNGWYRWAATKFIINYRDESIDDWPSCGNENPPQSFKALTRVATGRDGTDSTIDDISTGPVQLIKICSTTPRVLLELDEDKWRRTRRSQREAGLETIAILSKGIDMEVLVSPPLKKFLLEKHHDWCEEHLTEDYKTYSCEYSPVDSTQHPLDPEDVLAKLGELASSKGRLQLLAAIPGEPGEFRELRDLKADPALNIQPGTIDRYYRELEQRYGFVKVVESRYNSISLTSSGRYAQSLVTEDYRVRHPHQASVSPHTTNLPQSETRLVCRSDSPQPNFEGHPFEEALEANAQILMGRKVRKLSLPDSWLNDGELVERLRAGRHAEGVTLIDDRVSKFEDGRVAYLGHSENEVHVVTQWGGPVPTLVRLAATLFSDHAFDSILTSSRLSPILTDDTTFDLVRLGRQLGWYSEGERDYDQFRAKYSSVCTDLLGQLSSRSESPQAWSRVCKQAHGLLASATTLYDILGFDVTIHIRIPDTKQLTRDDSRYQKFIGFLQNTVPKSATYKGNSAPRMLLETDGDKLSYRLPVDIDIQDRHAELTANWVIVGPSVTNFQADIVEVLEAIPVREQIAAGTESGIVIPVEVARANTYTGIRETVETVLGRFDRTLADPLSYSTVTNMFLHVFGNGSKRSLTCSPFDVAEALIATNRLAPPGEPLSLPLLLRGLGAVSPKKVYPWLPPTARKLMRALFAAGRPIGRSEIIEKANISESSYDRHRRELERAGLLWVASTYRYEAVVPGCDLTSDISGRLAASDNNGSQYVLHQCILSAQIKSQFVASVLTPSRSVETVQIG
ncbi:hypothetical protein [Haloarchaeobius sp. HME9146]|uniref:hypothetical protein n=1 Tax=Haloarchaeobius sp. HME9146 TaxID=2978732 RepID=UPI0021C12F57|nr:hypothetical protein [Haloarchaeobius sp. HME9146]MCT9096963.1 hypothetical protein [Haloarchaeobius sp. HME9146]